MARGSYKFEAAEGGGNLEHGRQRRGAAQALVHRKRIDGDDRAGRSVRLRQLARGMSPVTSPAPAACADAPTATGPLQISHDDRVDLYFASITVLEGCNTRTVPLDFR